MPKPITKPQRYCLTLKKNAILAFSEFLSKQKPPRLPLALPRSDGNYDVAITMALLDQLQTAARPRENLSDTLLRIVSGKAGS